MDKITMEYRVPYADTDQMGVVYYGNYLTIFERARNELMRAMGYTYKRCEEEGWMLPVIHAEVDYRNPARYDDLLEVTAYVKEMRGIRLAVQCEVRRKGENAILVSGFTRHCFVSTKDFRPTQPPEGFIAMASRFFKTLACAALLPVMLALSGCWTFNETEYPGVAMTQANNSATDITISVSGFETTLTEYEAVHGYGTVYVPSGYGRRYYGPGHLETVSTITLVPQRRATDMFLSRAQDDFEKAGFTLGTGITDVSVEVRFEGPFVTSADEWRKFAWELFTVFFCDYGSVKWTAKLRIRDTKTGRLLFHRDYEQPYETHIFGLIPLFGPSASDAAAPVTMQCWCLAALTDRAVADATAFLCKSGNKQQ